MTATMAPNAGAMMQTLVDAAGAPGEPVADMADLAERLRSLLGVAANQVTRVGLGGNLFDVVVTSSGAQARAAVAVMDEIQNGCGPVIEDTRDGLFYWLVPPGTAGRWQPHMYAVCLGAPHKITLPPLTSARPPCEPGPYWFRPSASDRLVPATPLREALARLRPEPTPHAAFADRLGVTP
ncbi:hypothetical protein ACFVZH_39345 [Streptomyces sp. NPDC059534]|uniref:hypothetical protein n=1 Tax=Streptomyces sp. NPDC059534 TaxID=3346859 RepID=UPI00369E76EA